MSVKASISASGKHHLYFEELLSEAPRFVYLELTSPGKFSVRKETFQGRFIEIITVQIAKEDMDEIAIAWIKKRRLQGAVGGPIVQE
jgi:hypothetical protein